MRTTRRYLGCCTSRCTSTTIVFSIFALVTLPTSSVFLPRSATGALCVSVVITPYLPSPALLRRSIPGCAGVSLPAPDPFSLHAAASALPPGPCPAETSAGKSARPDPFRAPAIRSRLLRGTFRFAAPSLDSSRARDEFRWNGQLVRRQPQRLARRRFVDSRHFKHDAPGLHHRHPAFRSAFALAHAGFRGLLGERLVRENTNPQLATALDETRDGHARCFNLAVGDPSTFHSLQAIFPERQCAATPGLASAAAALLLSVFHLLRHQHRCLLALLRVISYQISVKLPYATATASGLSSARFVRLGTFSPW